MSTTPQPHPTACKLLSIVVPIFNEADNLEPLYAKLMDVVETLSCDYEIIFINDGSLDKSASRLNAMADANSHVKVIHFIRNFGQTAALMAGIDHAAGDVILPMDGDLQNDPKDIPRLLEVLEQGYDVCSGWRKHRKDNYIKRNLPSKLANAFISRVSGVRLHDYGCTLKAYRRSVIKGVKLYGEMHRFIPIYAVWQGARVTEIPVEHHPRKHGESKYGMERTMKIILDLIVVKFFAKYSQKPIYVFGAFGIFNLLASLLAFVLSLYWKFVMDVSLIQTPLPLLAVMTGVTGVMCILMGLLAEIIIRTYYESQNKPVYLISESRNIKTKNLCAESADS